MELFLDICQVVTFLVGVAVILGMIAKYSIHVVELFNGYFISTANRIYLIVISLILFICIVVTIIDSLY